MDHNLEVGYSNLSKLKIFNLIWVFVHQISWTLTIKGPLKRPLYVKTVYPGANFVPYRDCYVLETEQYRNKTQMS